MGDLKRFKKWEVLERIVVIMLLIMNHFLELIIGFRLLLVSLFQFVNRSQVSTLWCSTLHKYFRKTEELSLQWQEQHWLACSTFWARCSVSYYSKTLEEDLCLLSCHFLWHQCWPVSGSQCSNHGTLTSQSSSSLSTSVSSNLLKALSLGSTSLRQLLTKPNQWATVSTGSSFLSKV